MIKKITYPTGESLAFEYEAHEYGMFVKRSALSNFNPLLINESGTCGGLRIKSIKNYLNDNANSLASTKTYLYKNSNNTSSGILLNKPRYGIKYSASLYVGNPFFNNSIEDNNMIFRSNDLAEFNNIHIEYGKVTEILNDGSRIEYSFTNSSTSGYMDAVSYSYIPEKSYHGGNYKTWSVTNQTTLCNIVAPVSSKQFIRGRLLKTEIFNSSIATVPLYSETNTYENTYTDSKTYLPHYYVRALGYMPVYTGKYNAQSTTQTQRIDNIDVSKTNSCTYNAHGQVASQTTTDSKGITQTVEYKYITDTATYSGGTRTIDLMAKHNIINLPLREEVFTVENGVKIRIGGKRYTYFNPVLSKPAMIRLQTVESFDIETSGWIVDVTYNYYDRYGNLLEKEDANGLKTSYVYGYNGLYKIAEIANCSLTQVINISGLSGIQTAPLGANLSAATENGLRAIPQAEVTTFNYQPLVGLTKIKDSTGRSVNYYYNKFGKLDKTTNTANELIKRYKYSTDNN
jgi:YD repeat-containing protein